MWARRCGVPHLWPSRVKVVLFSVGTATIGFTIYSFMVSCDLGYLDLKNERSARSRVLCLSHWPLRNEGLNILDIDGWNLWLDYRDNRDLYFKEHACLAESSNLTCGEVRVPLSEMSRKLGSPLGSETAYKAGSHDMMGLYAHLFLLVAVCMWLAISFHDHALLTHVSKDDVLDLNGIKKQFPRSKMFFRYLIGWRLVKRLWYCDYKVLGRTFMALLLPLVFTWALFVFLFIQMPLIVAIFVCYPVRTSRLLILFLSIACILYALALTINALVFIASEEHRPHYAVTWLEPSSRDISGLTTCYCGCVYPVSAVTCRNLLFVGVLAIIKSFVVAFRTLKGLRRSNWANLMSVTFAVPVNAYAVEWQQPSGDPIKHRKAGEPVQSELAFDPFAMMDEQMNSSNTHVNLQPETVLEFVEEEGDFQERYSGSRWLQGPNIPSSSSLSLTYKQTEYIGCCGFPCRTGGFQGKISFDTSEEEEVAGNSVANVDSELGQPVELEEDLGTTQAEEIIDETGCPSVQVGFVPCVARLSNRQVSDVCSHEDIVLEQTDL